MYRQLGVSRVVREESCYPPHLGSDHTLRHAWFLWADYILLNGDSIGELLNENLF